jgi:hypothetical protein
MLLLYMFLTQPPCERATISHFELLQLIDPRTGISNRYMVKMVLIYVKELVTFTNCMEGSNI